MSSSEPAAPSSAHSQSRAPASKRWTHFHSALQLAIQRAAHKWTYEDFSECFELWCKEEPDGALGVFSTVSGHNEYYTTTRCEEILASYDARTNIDILHTVVTEARARRQTGEPPGNDTWKADLDPRSAVRARTIPVLREERDVLAEKLAELEKENMELQTKMVENEKAMRDNEEEESRRLDVLDELYRRWTGLPLEDIQEWTLRQAEDMSSSP